MIAKGSNSLKAYVGSTGVAKMYKGDVLVYGGEESILPEGYTRLQYITNPSNAYIDTGVAIGSDDVIEFKYRMTNSTSKDRALWGARDTSSSTTGKASWFNNYRSSSNYYRWGGKSSSNYSAYGRHALISGNVVYIYNANGGVENTWNSGAGTFQMTTTITLYAQHDGSNGSIRMSDTAGALLMFEIRGKWNGIPCIDPNGVVGMYDIVNQQFHSSPNGTAFTAGPEY